MRMIGWDGRGREDKTRKSGRQAEETKRRGGVGEEKSGVGRRVEKKGRRQEVKRKTTRAGEEDNIAGLWQEER